MVCELQDKVNLLWSYIILIFQSYVVCELHDKVNLLWSYIILIFQSNVVCELHDKLNLLWSYIILIFRVMLYVSYTCVDPGIFIRGGPGQFENKVL